MFDEEDKNWDGKGQNLKGSMLLRNVVKVEDVDDPIAVGEKLQVQNREIQHTQSHAVEEILARTAIHTLQKIYNLPEFASTLEFLTMLALSKGRLLKARSVVLPLSHNDCNPSQSREEHQTLSLPRDTSSQTGITKRFRTFPYRLRFTHPHYRPSVSPEIFYLISNLFIQCVVPTTSTATVTPIIAPGAENVGQAQILNMFSRPFELEGLYGAADGQFRGSIENDAAMDADGDSDRDVFWDAIDGGMEDVYVGFSIFVPPTNIFGGGGRIQIESDDLVLKRSRKRLRSSSPTPSTNPNANILNNVDPQQDQHRPRPKHQRWSKDVPAYNAPPDEHVLCRMERSNPLSRRVLKKEAKRVRKAQRVRVETDVGQDVGMEVDDEELQFTFMA